MICKGMSISKKSNCKSNQLGIISKNITRHKNTVCQKQDQFISLQT